MIHNSGVSAAVQSELIEYVPLVEGTFRRTAGADCDSSSATAGERWAGGCSREELMVVIQAERAWADSVM